MARLSTRISQRRSLTDSPRVTNPRDFFLKARADSLLDLDGNPIAEISEVATEVVERPVDRKVASAQLEASYQLTPRLRVNGSANSSVSPTTAMRPLCRLRSAAS